MTIISLENIQVLKQEKIVLHNSSLKLQAQERIAIIGETGSGKSTLLKLIAGLEQAEQGTVVFKNEQVIGPLNKLTVGHKGIGYLSQHYELRNNYIIDDYLDYGNQLSVQETSEIYRLCKIDHLISRKTNSGLSGGEKQRVALAKVLLTKPELLLLDEPFSNIDYNHKQLLNSVIENIELQLGLTIIMVSHEPTDILHWASKIIVLQAGRIIQKDTPYTIYYNPNNKYTAGLLGPCNFLTSQQLLQLNISYKGAIEDKIYGIRPNKIEVAAINIYPNIGFIKKIAFKGIYAELTLQINDLELIAHQINCTWKVADGISLNVQALNVFELYNN